MADDPFSFLQSSATGTRSPALDQSAIDRLFNQTQADFSRAEPYARQGMENARKSAAELIRQSDEAMRVANEPVERPKLPKLKDMPAPPSTQLKDPTQALGSVMGLFAVLASMASRRPLVAGMKAMTGIIKGNWQGQKDVQDYEIKRWKAGLEEARAQNQKELDEYNAALSNTKISMDEKLARLHALAIKHEDTAAAYQLENKGIEGFTSFLTDRAKISEQLLAHQIQWEWQRELAAFRYSPGRLTGAQYEKNQAIKLARQKWDDLQKDPASKAIIEGMKDKPEATLTYAEKNIEAIRKLAETPLYGDENSDYTFSPTEVGGSDAEQKSRMVPPSKVSGQLGPATRGSPAYAGTLEFAKKAIERRVPLPVVMQRWQELGGDPADLK